MSENTNLTFKKLLTQSNLSFKEMNIAEDFEVLIGFYSNKFIDDYFNNKKDLDRHINFIESLIKTGNQEILNALCIDVFYDIKYELRDAIDDIVLKFKPEFREYFLQSIEKL